MAVAMAGSLPSIRRSPNGVEAWRSLHLEIAKKKRQRRGLRMANDITSDRSKSTMFPILGLSMDQLGEDARTLFFNLVVLARGVPAPVDMLTNLWEQKVECMRCRCDGCTIKSMCRTTGCRNEVNVRRCPNARSFFRPLITLVSPTKNSLLVQRRLKCCREKKCLLFTCAS